MASEFIARNGIISNADSQVIGALTANTFIKSGGTSSQYLMADGSVSTLASTSGLTGSGTTNFLPRFTSSGTITTSDIYNAGNGNIGIGTTSAVTTGYRNITLNNASTFSGGIVYSLNDASKMETYVDSDSLFTLQGNA